MYLDYQTYQTMGGDLDNSAFTVIDRRAEYLINSQAGGKTGLRIRQLSELPQAVIDCTFDLITHLSTSTDNIASESQTLGGQSESKSYISKEEINAEAFSIIHSYLYPIEIEGHSILYKGVTPWDMSHSADKYVLLIDTLVKVGEDAGAAVENATKAVEQADEAISKANRAEEKATAIIKETESAKDNANTAADSANTAAVSANEATTRANAVSEQLENAKDLFCNALKGSKSDSIIQIDDVSPTDQRLNVSLTSDTVTDFSSKTVSVYGKNFAKLKTGTSYGLTLEWLENEGCYLVNGTCTLAGNNSLFTNVSTICGINGKAFTLKTKQISGSVKNADGKTKYAIFYTSTSADAATSGSANLIGANLNEAVVTKTATAVKDRLYNCRLYISEGVEFDNFKFTAQLEIGTTATDYETYKEPVTYKSTKGGSVSGVTLGTGAYNLCTNDSAVDINCEYNRDINKAFAELEEKLTNAILASGGNV